MAGEVSQETCLLVSGIIFEVVESVKAKIIPMLSFLMFVTSLNMCGELDRFPKYLYSPNLTQVQSDIIDNTEKLIELQSTLNIE